MKDIKKFLLLMLCFFININFCYAVASISFGYIDSGEEGNGNSNNNESNEPLYGEFTMDDGYKCSYNYTISTNASITIDGFNQNNESIIEGEVTPNESTKAGTSIGISIREIKSVTWDVFNVKVTGKSWERFYLFTCNSFASVDSSMYEKTKNGYYYTHYRNGELSKICTYITYVDEESGVLEKDDEKKKENCTIDANDNVNGIAKGYVGSASYSLNLKDPNNFNSDIQLNVVKVIEEEEDNFENKNFKRIYTYSPTYVCINKVTSEVRYGDNECTGDEFYIKNEDVNGVEHFHYFVPLNIVADVYSLMVSPISESSKKQCLKVIEENSNYYDFLLISTGGKYEQVSKTAAIAKSEVEDGCYIGTEIKIPVSKGIYNVEGNKINGYNLYVKNVDEDNPFPNPVTSLDSMWFDWYHSNYSNGSYGTGGSPNIRDSFVGGPSYSLENVNVQKIRDLKSDLGDYLRNSLDENGVSDFIKNKITFNTVANPGTFYKLGCGPLNSTETISDGTNTISNPLYQKECK